MLAPVLVITNTLATPAALILILPLAAGIFTLLLPLATGPIKLPTFTLPLILAVPVMLAPVLVTTNTLATPAALKVTLPLATGILRFEFPLVTVPADIVELVSKNKVLFDNHKSFHLLVELPKLYVTLAFGIKFDVTYVVTDRLLTVNRLPALTLPALTLPAALIVPLPNVELAVLLPTVNPINTPTVVKLEVTTAEFNVVPIKLAALAVITVLLAAVNWP